MAQQTSQSPRKSKAVTQSVPTGGASAKSPSRAKRSFLAEFIRNPQQIGALVPSSKHLAREMIKFSGIEHARTVVEYGPGTGAVSGHIADALPRGAKYFAVELSEPLAAVFRKRHPKLRIHTASVADMPRLLRQEGLPPSGSVDVIFSGLPWAAFPEKLQRQLLATTERALRPGGVMLTFSYAGFAALSPGGKRFRGLLPNYFARADKTSIVLRNFPPAFIYRCIKGLDPTARG